MAAFIEDTRGNGKQTPALHSSPRNIDAETTDTTPMTTAITNADSTTANNNNNNNNKHSSDDAAQHVNLYIRNVAPHATDQEIEHAFSKLGHVISCSVVRDPYTKDCRGFAFVKVASEQVADAVLRVAADQLSVCGRRLGVERARRNGPHEKTPGQYLGIDRSVRDRYAGYKRTHQASPRDSYHSDGRAHYDSYDNRRTRPGGGLARNQDRDRDRWDTSTYDDRDRYIPRRRLSPDRRIQASPRNARSGDSYRSHWKDKDRGLDRPGRDRGTRDNLYDDDRDGPSMRGPARRSNGTKDANSPIQDRRDDYGRDRR